MELLINEDMYDVAIPVWVMKDSSTFRCESFVRGCHIYMNIWEPLVAECLKSRKEQTNEKSKTAVININSYSEEVVLGMCQRICPRLNLCSYLCPIVLWTSL